MQETWNHGRAHYRCRFRYEYARANRIEHPAAVYLREDAVVEPLDAWMAKASDPERPAVAPAAIDDEPAADTAVEAVRRELADCDRVLARHRAALEAGADPQLVAEWTRDVRRRRESAEAGLLGGAPNGRVVPIPTRWPRSSMDSVARLRCCDALTPTTSASCTANSECR